MGDVSVRAISSPTFWLGLYKCKSLLYINMSYQKATKYIPDVWCHHLLQIQLIQSKTLKYLPSVAIVPATTKHLGDISGNNDYQKEEIYLWSRFTALLTISSLLGHFKQVGINNTLLMMPEIITDILYISTSVTNDVTQSELIQTNNFRMQIHEFLKYNYLQQDRTISN